ncbi:oral-facial-digital syndrome 1 protein isoform X3 [Oryzias latipes]|uniref:OFD1 centriole and centriolar satellite protein n=1 Tax=Oryzias latipes TaxID=8090 RepID=H2MU35_ORYLA|nr:oral-facial-digital syndrome 1 protein isoform X3 [Oryzias latipes]
MSTSKEVEAFSSDELRKRLYQTFKSKGFLDSLKAQLRNQLIQELKHPPLTGQEPVPRLVPLKTDTLLASACNSIVADHLQASGYEYTLSVFCPESGLNKDKVLKKDDLLQILKINPESKLYKSVACKENDNKGFLFNLLTHLTSHNAPSPRQDADAQTTTASNYGESLVEKMKTIDKEYEHFNKDQMFSFQSKLAAYKREIETQMEASMNVKLHHFKEVEMAKVRLEEKSKFHKEFDNLKRELERNYEMKAKALMEREKNAIEGLQKHKEIEEKDMYMQRQSTLKDIESLRYRENELRMRMEAFEKTCQIHAEKVKTAEELLRRRELAVKTMEDTYEQKLKNELSSYQLELKEEFIKRTEKLTENENRNRVEAARIQQESAALNARSEEHSRTCAKLKQLQADLDTAQQQISLLTQQKDLLRERLESTSDYPSLRRERTELQEQMQLLKKQLEEVREENRRLHAEMATPSKEQLALQVELQRLQNARRLDEEDFDNQREVLQAQLQNESDRCAQLKAQLLDHQERAQWMNSHVEELKMKLRHTQQEAVVSPAVSPQPLCDGSFKRAPAATAAAADFSPEISPPHSPQLKSTARDQSSPLESRPVFSSSESSPQPEKIKLEDLTEVLESSHIPELLLDTAGSHSEKAPDGPSTAHPQDLPEDPGDSEAREGSPNMPQTLGESARVQEEDVEEQRWEKERKDQQEKREGELEEAKEREQQELERLEKEMLLQNVEQLEKESEVDKEEDDGQKKEADQSREESKVENPLEKYMKMVLEAREKRREESPQREEAGQTSPENISFNDDTEQSAALHSPKEMEDDFW